MSPIKLNIELSRSRVLMTFFKLTAKCLNISHVFLSKSSWYRFCDVACSPDRYKKSKKAYWWITLVRLNFERQYIETALRSTFLVLQESRITPQRLLQLYNPANLGSPEVSLGNPPADSIQEQSRSKAERKQAVLQGDTSCTERTCRLTANIMTGAPACLNVQLGLCSLKIQ